MFSIFSTSESNSSIKKTGEESVWETRWTCTVAGERFRMRFSTAQRHVMSENGELKVANTRATAGALREDGELGLKKAMARKRDQGSVGS